MNRPLVWIALAVMGCMIIYDFIFPLKETYEEKDCDVCVTGIIDDMGTTASGMSLVLTHVDGDEQCSRGKVLVYLEEGSYQIGQTVSIQGSCQSFQSPGNQGQFDEFTYYAAQNIWYRIFANQIKIKNSSYHPYRQCLYVLKRKVMRLISDNVSGEEANVLSSIIAGDSEGSYEKTKRLYRECGIIHIIVISGGHIALIAGFIFALLKKMKIPMQIAAALTMLFIYIYGDFTGFSVSTSRAVIMMLMYLFAKIVGRTYDLLTGLALSSMIIVFTSPLQLYQPGFLLSFGTVLGIYFVAPMGSQYIKRKIMQGLMMTVSALVFTLPVLLYYYSEISLCAPIVNVLCLPFLSILLVTLFAALPIAILFPVCASFIFLPSFSVLVIYNQICTFFSSISIHKVVTGQPPILAIIAYYVILIFGIILFKCKKRRLSAVAFLFLFVIFIPRSKMPLEVHFLDVGQGDCTVIENEGSCVMIDGGSSTVKDVGKYRIMPFLKSRGIVRVDYIFVSHCDQDHINGIMEMVANQKEWGIDVGYLVISCMYEEDELTKVARDNGTACIVMNENELWTGGFTLKCLFPNKNSPFTDPNDNSMVLRLEYSDFSCLFTGDMSEESENEMKTQCEDCDILKVAHHGSKSSSSELFLKGVLPEYAMISVGKENRYGHPAPETVTRLEEAGAMIWQTPVSGEISVGVDEKGYTVKGYKK